MVRKTQTFYFLKDKVKGILSSFIFYDKVEGDCVFVLEQAAGFGKSGARVSLGRRVLCCNTVMYQERI